MGPFELMDLIGLDVNLAVTKSVWAGLLPRSALRAVGAAAGAGRRRAGSAASRDAASTTMRPAPTRPQPQDEPARAAPGEAHGPRRARRCGAARRADRGGGVAVERARADSRFPAGALHVPGKAGGAWLALTDGRTATLRAVATGVRDLVLFDLAHRLRDGAATRGRPRRHAAAMTRGHAAVGALAGGRHRGQPPRRRRRPRRDAHRRDARERGGRRRRPGRRAPRTRSISRCRQGVNYPRGPLAWADAIGAATVRDVLAQSRRALRRGSLPDLAARRATRGDRRDARWVSIIRR